MAISVKHTKVSAVADGPDASVVRPSDWNADHTLTGLGTMAEQNANTVAITGGSINNTPIGGTTPAAGAFTTLSADRLYASEIASVASFSWDSATSTPAASSVFGSGPPVVTNIHRRMRRCVVNDAGSVVYYLDPNNSTLKEDGTAADLSGAAGQVMVEIPLFYEKRVKVGTVTTWSISDVPLSGFTMAPAFIKDGVVVPFRYYGAYDACYFEASSSTYKSGLNLDALTVSTVNDKLASVSGVYPIVGVDRPTVRALAANRGAGWCVADFWLVQAVRTLFLIEYQTFSTQSVLGMGNTNGSYLASSSLQTDSPHTVAGASNSLGNNSTNATSGAGVNVKPGISFMSYRGIENWFGNAWNWIDGFNINERQAYVSSNRSHFADNVSANYTLLGSTMPVTDGYVTGHQDIDHAYLPAGIGGSTSTYWTDYYYQFTGWRAGLIGGGVYDGADAGGFCWNLYSASSRRNRFISARLAR